MPSSALVLNANRNAPNKLRYEACGGKAVTANAKLGSCTSEPLGDNPHCVLKTQKVYLSCVVHPPECHAQVGGKPWHIANSKHWPHRGLMVLELQRAELKPCCETTTIAELEKGCDCYDELQVKQKFDCVRYTAEHLERKEELKNDALWCTDFYKICLDKDIGIQPGFRILHEKRWLKVSSVLHEGNPAKLTEVLADAH